MPNSRSSYPEEFRRWMTALVRTRSYLVSSRPAGRPSGVAAGSIGTGDKLCRWLLVQASHHTISSVPSALGAEPREENGQGGRKRPAAAVAHEHDLLYQARQGERGAPEGGLDS